MAPTNCDKISFFDGEIGKVSLVQSWYGMPFMGLLLLGMVPLLGATVKCRLCYLGSMLEYCWNNFLLLSLVHFFILFIYLINIYIYIHMKYRYLYRYFFYIDLDIHNEYLYLFWWFPRSAGSWMTSMQRCVFFAINRVLAYFLDARLPYIEPFVTSALSRNVEQL